MTGDIIFTDMYFFGLAQHQGRHKHSLIHIKDGRFYPRIAETIRGLGDYVGRQHQAVNPKEVVFVDRVTDIAYACLRESGGFLKLLFEPMSNRDITKILRRAGIAD